MQSMGAQMNIKSIIHSGCPAFLRPLLARIETSPLGYRLARGAFWSLSGALIARGLGLLASILVARILGKGGYGELGIVQSTLGLFGTFAGFGLGMTATKFIAQYRTTDPVRAGRIRALSSAFAWVSSGITSVILLFMAPWLAEHTLAAPQLTGLLQIGSLFLLLTAVNGAQIGALSGFEAFKTVAKISLWSGLANFPLMVGGVYRLGLYGAVGGMTIATGVNWLLNHIAIRKECAKAGVPYTYSGCWRERAVLWKFSLPALISGLFIAPTEWALNAMLVNQPGGYGEMGLFNAAKQWHILILYLPSMLSTTTLPILSNLLGENKKRQYNKMLIANSVLLSGIAFIVAVPVSLFSRAIMSLYGTGFSDGGVVLNMVALYSVLWAANIVIGQVLWSTDASGLATSLAALRAVLLLGTFSFVVPKNAYGMALAFTITYILQTIYQGIIAIKSANRFFLARAQTP
ncbi:MAG TPA: oligosaccharide flippase family protein [Geobacteraceae bacterium]|nr:oligosaccharide flippase family protein [Geobacteraceae bacterium]